MNYFLQKYIEEISNYLNMKQFI